MANQKPKTRVILGNGKKKLIAVFSRKPVLETLSIADYLANKKQMPVKQIDY